MKREIFEEYAVQVAKEFHLELDSLFKKSKQRNLVDARQILYLLCVDRPIRLSFIKSYLDDHGYDVPHSTIKHGYKKAKELVEADPDYQHLVEKIKKKCMI